MPIKSYIVLPKEGKREALLNTLSAMQMVEVEPSVNQEAIVLVTDTPSDNIDKQLFNDLSALDDLQMITLVSAFADPNDNN